MCLFFIGTHGGVYAACAERQRVAFRLRQPRAAHQREHIVALRHGGDTLWQIGVGTRVVRHQPAHRGDNMPGI